MKTYRVKVKQVFTGIVEVQAESKERAKFIVTTGLNQPTLNVHHTHTWETGKSKSEDAEEGIVDWDFDIHSQDIKIY